MNKGKGLTLYPHQEHGVVAISVALSGPHRTFLLADEMGLGKTAQAHTVMQHLAQATGAFGITPQARHGNGILVVCPACVIDRWAVPEIKHTLDVRVFRGKSAIQQTLVGIQRNTVVVVSHATYRNAYRRYIDMVFDSCNASMDEMARYLLTNGRHVEMRSDGSPATSRHLLVHACSILRGKQRKRCKRRKRNPTGTIDLQNNNRDTGVLALVSRYWSLMVMDEAHVIRSQKSAITEAIGFISTHMRLIISGTPITNGVHELLPLLRNAMGVFSITASTPCEKVYAFMSSVYLRRTKQDVCIDIPERDRTLEIVHVEWNDPYAEREYVAIRNVSLDEFSAEKHTANMLDFKSSASNWRLAQSRVISNFMMHIQRMKQICIHPMLPGFMVDKTSNHIPIQGLPNAQRWAPRRHNANNYSSWQRTRMLTMLMCVRRVFRTGYSSGNIRTLLCRHTIDEDLKNNMQPSPKMLQFWSIFSTSPVDVKFILVCSFRLFMTKIMGPWLADRNVGYRVLCGSNKTTQDRALLDFRDTAQNIRVLLMVKGAGALGRNLQDVASACIIMDPHYNDALDEQASQRIDRIGQSKVVLIRRFLMSYSIDCAFHERQVQKKKSIDACFSNIMGQQQPKSTQYTEKRPCLAADLVNYLNVRDTVGGGGT